MSDLSGDDSTQDVKIHDPVEVTPPMGSIDTSGRSRVSNENILAEHPHTLGKGDRYWHEKITGDASASWDSDMYAVVSSSGLAINAKVERQTYRVMQYFKGASAFSLWSISFVEERAGCVKCFMVGDQFNGVGLQLNGSTLQMLIRSDVSGSVVETVIDQADWSEDKLDGTGKSGVTLDITKDMLVEFSYTHLGVGPVRLSIHVGGDIIFAHVHKTANFLAAPWCKSGSLPMRTEMTNTTAQGTETTMRMNCANFVSDGGSVNQGLILPFSTGVNTVSVNRTESVVFGIRLSEATRYLSALPIGYDMKTKSGSKHVFWRVLYRPTIVNGVWSAINGVLDKLDSYSSYSGGFSIAEGHFDLSVEESEFINLIEGAFARDAYLGYDIDHNSEPLLLVAETVSGSGSIFVAGSARIFL